jgi:hypothetical protein
MIGPRIPLFRSMLRLNPGLLRRDFGIGWLKTRPHSTRTHPHSARSHLNSTRSHPHSARSHINSTRSHPHSAIDLI